MTSSSGSVPQASAAATPTAIAARRAPHPPLVMGHETSGTVVAIGPAVSNVAVGDRIFVSRSSGACAARPVRRASSTRAPRRRVYGAEMPGSFAELVRIKARSAVPIPDSVSFLQAALIEQLSVVIKGISRANIAAGDSVAVVGAGPIGMLSLSCWASTGRATSSSSSRTRIGARRPSNRRDVDHRSHDRGCLHRGRQGHRRRRRGRLCRGGGITSSVAAAVNIIRAGGQMVWLATRAVSSGSTSSRSSGTS